jgi:hypothetical protein
MNSLYGKLLQDKSSYKNMRPYTDPTAFGKAAGKANCVNFNIMQLDDDSDLFFGLVETNKRGGVLLDTPRAAGFAILELSKLVILQAHYGYYKTFYGDNAKLLFTDTDSLAYLIQTENLVADMATATSIQFDAIDSLTEIELRRITNSPEERNEILERFTAAKGSLGAMKLESKEAHIQEFVGLASKMYSLKLVEPAGAIKFSKKGKGVPARVLKQQAAHEDFKRMIFEPFDSKATFRTFRSENHELQQRALTKRMLTAFNDKVYQLSPSESRPLGHHRNPE